METSSDSFHWRKKLLTKWKTTAASRAKSQTQILIQGISFLQDFPAPPPSSLALSEQPFDAHLLALCPLYRRSRELYLQQKGAFMGTLVSSPRTLSSSVLLENRIEYSPVEKELVWAATNPIERKNPEHLLKIRTFVSSLFHEQNHRILWKLLPAPPSSAAGIRMYLNFVESLVITLDMALADSLGPELAKLFYLTGTIYDPGTSVRIEMRNSAKDQRLYRNYLQASLYATYLNLEMYDPRAIAQAIQALFPHLGKLAPKAAQRALQLDPAFVQNTNPIWQKRYAKEAGKTLREAKKSNAPVLALVGPSEAKTALFPILELSKDPADNRLPYLWTEKWLDLMEL
jgi:hypothetical protein